MWETTEAQVCWSHCSDHTQFLQDNGPNSFCFNDLPFYSTGRKSSIFCFALLLPQIVFNFQNQGQIWNLLVLTFQNTPYMYNLTKFWLRYLRLKTHDTILLFSWFKSKLGLVGSSSQWVSMSLNESHWELEPTKPNLDLNHQELSFNRRLQCIQPISDSTFISLVNVSKKFKFRVRIKSASLINIKSWAKNFSQ